MAAWTPPSTAPAYPFALPPTRALGASPLAAAPAMGVLLTLLLASPALSLPVIGSSSGSFLNPEGPVGTVSSGTGTSHFAWGDGAPFASPPSSLNFTGKFLFTNTGSPFSFGSLSYYNGTTALGTEATGVDLRVALNLMLPSVYQPFDFGLNLLTTPNSSDAAASADIVEWSSSFSGAAFQYAGIDYTLEFLGFGTITGSGYSSVDRFHVLEGGSASADLLGRITEAPQAVPEPTALALFSLGILGAGLAARKRKNPLL